MPARLSGQFWKAPQQARQLDQAAHFANQVRRVGSFEWFGHDSLYKSLSRSSVQRPPPGNNYGFATPCQADKKPRSVSLSANPRTENGIGAPPKRFRSGLKKRAANVEIFKLISPVPFLLSRFVKFNCIA